MHRAFALCSDEKAELCPFLPLLYMTVLSKEVRERVCDDRVNAWGWQGGSVKLYKGLACPLDNYEIVLFSLTGPDAKTYPLCPFCYNNPPAGAKQVITQSSA